MSAELGLSNTKNVQDQKSFSGPWITNTGNSRIDKHKLIFDPSIRAGENEALQQYAGIYGGFGDSTRRYIDQIGELRNRITGNESDYMRAITDPITQKYAQARGATERSIGLRGIAGSSFADNSMRSLAQSEAQDLGNARATAMMDVLQMQDALINQGLSAERALAQMGITNADMIRQVQNARAQREFQMLGIGQMAIGKGVTDQWGGYAKAGTAPPTVTTGSCWVAEELYGKHSHKTIKLREYFGTTYTESGINGKFSRLYNKHGKKWAKIVKKNILAKLAAHIIWGVYWLIAKGK